MNLLTIPSPNTDRSLLTLAELRVAAGVTDNSRDAELTLLGDYISATITSACHVLTAGAIPPTLRLESVTETFRTRYSSHPQALPLGRRPVVAITSVTEDTTVLATTDYEEDQNLLYRLSGSRHIRWPCTAVLVAYSAGYATVPADLKYAALKFARATVQTSDRDPALKRKVTQGVSEYEWWVDPTKDKVIPPEVFDILVSGGYVRQWSWLS